MVSKKARDIARKINERKRGDAWEPPPPPKPKRQGIGRKLSSVEPVVTDWLWKGYLPLGKLCIIDGDPGCGKSFLTMGIASIVTTAGQFIDGWTPVSGGVVILNSEDTAEDTVRGRVEACGGDLDRVLHIEEIDDGRHGPRQMTFPSDIGLLDSAIQEMEAALVIIDPITNHLDPDINPIADVQVRRALQPLKLLAHRRQCTILMVRHLNKSEDKSPLNRGSGAPAFVGVSRVGLIVGKDPDNENCRIMAINKCNLCDHAKSVKYSIENGPNGLGFVRWHGLSEHTAKSVFAGVVEDIEDKGALSDAQGVLRHILSRGKVSVVEVEEQASQANISKGSLRRAKDSLGVKSVKEGVGEKGKWYWQLPYSEAEKRS